MISVEDALAGFVLDSSALVELGSGPKTYATTWADRTAVRGVVLLVPTAALSEAWQEIRRTGPRSLEQMRKFLSSPMVLIEDLDAEAAEEAGELAEGKDRPADVMAAHVVSCARGRGWPVMAAHAAARVRAFDSDLPVETLPGTS